MGQYCLHCQEFYSDSIRHKCPPAFRVFTEELGQEGDGDEVYARSAEEAATKWAEAEDVNSAEYDIVAQRSEPVVTVVDEAGNKRCFQVRGEAVPQYWATEIVAAAVETES